ncbi:hypothetical protein AB0I81_17695 [Nonomuraea sp. NPDC050404]|uniref:hypothetical protein n=1 Tax=Nonomuraea sp. NPDC050404 TaxID=3155783 RepID=UPI0033C09D23
MSVPVLAVPAVSGGLFTLRRRPAVRILAAVWLAQVVGFAYLLSYVLYQTAGAESGNLLPSLLPARSADYIVGSLPLWGGPVLVILGALASGTDFRTGSLVTLLPRFPDRTWFMLGRFAALVAITAGYAVLTLVVTAASSFVISLMAGEPAHWPGPVAWLRGFAAVWLVMTAFAALGYSMGVVTRSLPAAIGIGLLWTPGAENVLAMLAGAFEPLTPLRAALLSPSAGSLAAAMTPEDGAPGVAAISSPAVAITVLACWIVIPLLVSLAVFRRRDVT